MPWQSVAYPLKMIVSPHQTHLLKPSSRRSHLHPPLLLVYQLLHPPILCMEHTKRILHGIIETTFPKSRKAYRAPTLIAWPSVPWWFFAHSFLCLHNYQSLIWNTWGTYIHIHWIHISLFFRHDFLLYQWPYIGSFGRMKRSHSLPYLIVSIHSFLSPTLPVLPISTWTWHGAEWVRFPWRERSKFFCCSR